MKTIYPETKGAAYHAAGVLVNANLRRVLSQPEHRAHPLVAWILGEGPRPAGANDPNDDSTESEVAA